MSVEVIVNEGGEHEGGNETPHIEQEPAPSISAEAVRLIEESAALRAGLELFRAEIAGLVNRLDAHERATAGEFLAIRELIDAAEEAAEAAEEIAAAAVEVATETVEEIVEESGDLGGEVPASVAEAEALEPPTVSEEPARERKRAFIRL